MDKLLSYNNRINESNSINEQHKLKNEMYNHYIKNFSNNQSNNSSMSCNSMSCNSNSYSSSVSHNSINSGSITGFNSNNSLSCYTR
jgi:hypothetical protein